MGHPRSSTKDCCLRTPCGHHWCAVTEGSPPSGACCAQPPSTSLKAVKKHVCSFGEIDIHARTTPSQPCNLWWNFQRRNLGSCGMRNGRLRAAWCLPAVLGKQLRQHVLETGGASPPQHLLRDWNYKRWGVEYPPPPKKKATTSALVDSARIWTKSPKSDKDCPGTDSGKEELPFVSECLEDYSNFLTMAS